MNTTEQERILIVDINPLFLERLALELRARNFDVVVTESATQALQILRDWHRPIDWLFSRAILPGLIDGWILADEYHDSYPNRAAVIAAPEVRVSAQGHIVLKDPPPTAVLETMRCIMSRNQSSRISCDIKDVGERLAA
jgi:CheY-like chemotaxis protein